MSAGRDGRGRRERSTAPVWAVLMWAALVWPTAAGSSACTRPHQRVPALEAPAVDYMASWHAWVADETRTFTVHGGEARLEAGRPGAEPWHAQLYATLPPLQGPVVLTANLRAPLGTPINGMCQIAASPYTWTTGPADCAPTPEGASCRVECPNSTSATKVGFEMGRATGPVEVTDVRFRRIRPPPDAPDGRAASAMEPALVAHFPLDEIDPGAPEDLSTRHLPGLWHGAASVVQGRRGLAADLDGSTRLEIAACPTDAGTFTAWVRPEALAAEQVIFSCGEREVGLSGVDFTFRTGSARVRVPARAGGWVHLGATWDKGAFVLYVDGVESGVGRAAGRRANAPTGYVGGPPGRGFSGAVDEVRVYDRALTAPELDTLRAFDAVPNAFAQNRRLARGVNLGDGFEVLPGSDQPHFAVTPEDLRTIRAAGFTWVRIPVAWMVRTLPDAPDRLDPAGLPAVDALIKQALTAGLAVVLDVHNFDELMEDPTADRQDRLVAIWRQLAVHYRGFPDTLMFELLNEPRGALDANRLNPLLSRIIEAVRASDATRTLLVEPPGYGSASSIRTLDLPEAERNLIVTIHAYEPVPFTHAGTEPARPPGTRWEGEDATGPIVTQLRWAATYGSDHGRPVNIGEFGTFREADRASRLRWNRYVMTAAEELGLSWGVWSYAGGWGLYDTGAQAWDGELLRSVLSGPGARAHLPELAAPVVVTPSSGPVEVDGVLDEPLWRDGPAPTVFRPDGWTGDSPRRTEVRVRQADERIYVGVHAVEPRIGAPSTTEPDAWAAPWFVVVVDRDGDPTTGFGAAARVGDADDFAWVRGRHRSWEVGLVQWSGELGLEARGAETTDGFQLEMSLPIEALGGSESGADWRVRFLRTNTLMDQGDYGYPEAARTLLQFPNALEGMVPLVGVLPSHGAVTGSDIPPAEPRTGARRPIRVGLHPGDVGHRRVADYETLLGVKFDDELMFQRVDRLSFAAVRERLDGGHGVTLNLEFATGASVAQDAARLPVLHPVAAGAFDTALRTFAQELARDGREIQIRTLHEFNGDWYPWGVLHPSGQNSIASFKDAWRHVVTVFRDAGAQVRFQMDYNARNGRDVVTRFAAFYPGDDWVDSVAVTTYNGTGTRDFSPEWWESFRAGFDEPYRQIAALTRRPIAVAETATRTAPGRDKPAWIREAFEDLANRYPQVDEVDWFLEDKEGNWDLHAEADRQAFREGFAYLKKARGGP